MKSALVGEHGLRFRHLHLALKPGQPIKISSEGLRQNLERHLPIQLRIGGLVDLAHAPLTDEGGDVVVAEAGADFESHGLCVIY